MRYFKFEFNFKKIVFCFLFLNLQSLAVELIQGDAGEGAATTFTFPVQSHVMSNWGVFFVGAHPNGIINTNDYAVSFMSRTGTIFYPMTPESVILDGEIVDNSLHLYNKKINILSLLQPTIAQLKGQYPVVVPENDIEKLYVFNTFADSENISMVHINDIKDSLGTANSKISGLTTSGSCVFAGIYPNLSFQFGDVGSGIALLLYGDKVEEDGEIKIVKRAIEQANNAIGELKATALDKTSDFVKPTVGANLTNFLFRDVHWDNNIGVFYGSFKSDGANGSRAVVAGTIKENAFVLKKISFDLAFVGDNEIVGTSSANSVEITKLKSMWTSTWLNYLIVLGGNTTGVDIKKDLFALPIVNDPTSDNHGMLAKFDSEPVDIFWGDKLEHSVFRGRTYKTAAAVNADILKINSKQAMIGGGSAPGDVLDIVVEGDSVFVAVNISYANGEIKKRVYFSRALFDELGRINGWTDWQIVKGSESKIFGLAFEVTSDNLISMENDTPVNNDVIDEAGIKSVRRTQWGSGDEDGLGDLNSVLSTEFPQQDGGIHGLFDFSSIYFGCENAGFIIATGSKKVAFIETERASLINKGNFSANTVSFENGLVTQTFAGGNAVRVVVIKGGVLDDIGPIECSEIAYETIAPSTRIFVGGPGGLAVLVNADGSGIAGELKAGFEGIVNNMLFKKIGDYSFVRALVADNNFLYVLTDTKLDRINLVGNNFITTTLAEVGTNSWKADTTFLDIIVSGKLCLLGTSDGLYRTGNGKNITDAVPVDVGWTKIEQPGIISGPALKLRAITENGVAQNLFSGGNFEVLNGYIGKNKANLNRFSVSDFSGVALSGETIKPLEDGFVQSREGGLSKTYFIGYGSFRNQISDNGSFSFSSQERDNIIDPSIKFFGPTFRSGLRYSSAGSVTIPVDFSGTSDVVKLVRSSASGDFIAATDSGLIVNE